MSRATDIFAMLREGRLDEALVAARQLYADDPANVWNLRAIVRALCKGIWESKDAWQSQQLAGELDALPALPEGENDAQLTEYRARSVRRADPLSQRLFAIRDASKNGAHADALRQLRQLHREHPDRHDVDESLAWEVWHALVEALRVDKPDRGSIRNLLLEYRSLHTERPSVIHSRILEIAARAAHDEAFLTFCGFLQWWDTANLRDEDFRGTPGNDGKAFPSVVERTIQGLGKALKKETNPACIQFARDFIAQHYERYPDQEWFPFYMARALTKAGNAEAGMALLVPIVRRKQTESWAWHHLAECFSAGDPKRLACLSRAVLCRVDEPQKLFPVRMDLAEELQHAGCPDLAKHEVDEVVRVRQANGWPIREDLLEMTQADWYRNAQVTDGTTRYKEWAESASAVLTSGLPWHDAVLGVKGVTIGEHKNRFAILDIRQKADGIASVPVKMKAFAALADCPVGTPLALQIDTDSDRPLVVSVRVRDGQPWDILPAVPALVHRVNAERGVTTLLAEDGTECFAYHNDVSAARSLKPGTVVGCSVVKDARRTKVRNVSEFTGAAHSAFWKEYGGSFRPREQGGGHIGDVFAHARLTAGFAAGSTARGMAVKITDAETRRSWWEAVTAQQSSESTNMET